MSAPAGWYAQPDGHQGYWDGELWTADFDPNVRTFLTGDRVMFCSNCGNKAIEGDLFCATCGHALDPVPAVEAVVATLREETSKPDQGPLAQEASPPGRTWQVHRRLAIYVGIAVVAVVAMLGVVSSTATPGSPPADPGQALHRLKDVAKIDLPIADAGGDLGMSLVPDDRPQQPASVGEYLGALSMTSGGTIELRVSAYALETDAAAYALWWNTSGAKEFIGGSEAVQCGRIVVDGAWVERNVQEVIIKLLNDAYPDCTPYIPEKTSAPAPAPTSEPAPPVSQEPIPKAEPTRVPLAAINGAIPPDGYPTIAGAFVITNIVVTNNGNVSLTVKNTTKLSLVLRPVIQLSEGDGVIFARWEGGDCYTFRANASERITLKQESSNQLATSGVYPINWISAYMVNDPIRCQGPSVVVG